MPPDDETVGSVLIEIRDLLRDILNTLGGPANAEAWDHNRCVVATPGDPKQLSPMAIPDGMEAVIRALPGNTDSVYVGNSKAAVLDVSKRIELQRGAYTRLRITNTDLVWVDAEKASEGVDFWCEEEV